ncbi:hypothetical protein QMA67_00615 [Gluconobacter japonicus]|uniref:hypothetical protein n=1 Tax=Gluconobacter japonicus TaxID=376620 RepID=UPI001B8C6793|nr:hypothetical protein [Gluconobacter japonicus]MBS1049506.1 hypothetical protein [Gluconobacter japonicus]MDI6651440.1 hypothetical protein [Gluconobacter japonicus]
MTIQPEPKPQLLPQQETPRSRSLWAGGTLLAVASIGAGAFFFTHSTSTPAAATLASPSGNQTASAASTFQADAQLSMIAPGDAPKALAGTSFTEQQKSSILAAVRRGDMRLVEMPVLDGAGVTGQTVDVTVSGFTQRIVLTGKFQHLVLPIVEAAQVTIDPVTMPHAPALTIGALTALGPEALPSLTALTQRIVLDVIVQ